MRKTTLNLIIAIVLVVALIFVVQSVDYDPVVPDPTPTTQPTPTINPTPTVKPSPTIKPSPTTTPIDPEKEYFLVCFDPFFFQVTDVFGESIKSGDRVEKATCLIVDAYNPAHANGFKVDYVRNLANGELFSCIDSFPCYAFDDILLTVGDLFKIPLP